MLLVLIVHVCPYVIEQFIEFQVVKASLQAGQQRLSLLGRARRKVRQTSNLKFMQLLFLKSLSHSLQMNKNNVIALNSCITFATSLPGLYCIEGNFRGRKLSHISQFVSHAQKYYSFWACRTHLYDDSASRKSFLRKILTSSDPQKFSPPQKFPTIRYNYYS